MNVKLTQDNDIKAKRIKAGKVPAIVISSKPNDDNTAPGLLWIHGGGYFLGMKEMVYMSRAINLVRKFGIKVISPGYRLSFLAPYPAAINDCYEVLLYIKKHAEELGVDENIIMVGGESAGGGLCAALCIMARDRGEVDIKYQFPLYPMLDNFDTESSRDNHGKVWNTKLNHSGWKMYLRNDFGKAVSPYASPARETDYSNLPPCYTFVGNGEPFLEETKTYIENLKRAGIKAELDVYDTDIHAFDMLYPDMNISKQAIVRFEQKFQETVCK